VETFCKLSDDVKFCSENEELFKVSSEGVVGHNSESFFLQKGVIFCIYVLDFILYHIRW
jgi:hypothetical protein